MQSQPSHYCWLQHSQVPVWRDICQKQKREKNLNIIQENHPKVEIFNFHSMAVAETWSGLAGRRQADHPTIMPFIISTHQMLMVHGLYGGGGAGCGRQVILWQFAQMISLTIQDESQPATISRQSHISQRPGRHDLRHVTQTNIYCSTTQMKNIIDLIRSWIKALYVSQLILT